MLKKEKYIYSLIVVICFLIYGNTVKHDFSLDDKIVISENDNVQRGFAAIPSIFGHTTDYGYVDNNEGMAYRPITLMSYAIEIGIFGLKPTVHHFFNVLFYSILCLLIYYLLSEFLFPQKHKLFSVFVTVLFAIHPLHTEVVSNIKSRDELFSFMFLILSLILLFKYLESKKIINILLSLFSYLLSLFSKENAVVFVFIIPLFLHFFGKLSVKEIFRLTLPYLVMLSFFIVVRYIVVSGRGAEITYVNNAILNYDGFFERYVMVFYILLLYLKLLVFPYPLIWDYSYGHFGMNNVIVVFGIISLIIYLSMFIYAVAGFKKKNIFSFNILFYLLTLSVVSNVFFFIGSTMSERFLFVPSFAFCIVIIILAGKLFNVNFLSKKLRLSNGVKVGFIALFLVLSVYSYSESRQWSDDYTLTIGDHGKTHSFRSRMSYIELLYKNANDIRDNRDIMNRARTEMETVLKDFPGEAEAWYLNGLIDMAYNDSKGAILSYEKTLSLNERHLDALNNLGTIYHRTGEYDKALVYYNAALEIDSSYYRVYGNIGMIYHFLEDYDKASEYYQILLNYDPGNATIRKNLEMVEREFKNLKMR